MSEYPGNEPAQKWTFPKRNRIVAGLCDAVLVIEAAENSGSLITANYAFKMKRKVFAVPGSLFSKNSVGTIQLIRKNGCIVTSSGDILDFFDKNQDLAFRGGKPKTGTCLKGKTNELTQKPSKNDSRSLKFSKTIKNLLKIEPLTIDELLCEINTNFEELNKKLLLMELSGELIQIEGRYYVD